MQKEWHMATKRKRIGWTKRGQEELESKVDNSIGHDKSGIK